jgi:hypothetical protein
MGLKIENFTDDKVLLGSGFVEFRLTVAEN